MIVELVQGGNLCAENIVQDDDHDRQRGEKGKSECLYEMLALLPTLTVKVLTLHATM